MKTNAASPKFFYSSARCGLKSCLSSWKSDKSDSDSANSPKGFHVLSSGLQPRSTEETK
jgi:hypothetical protein